jgi:hypothetical protein
MPPGGAVGVPRTGAEHVAARVVALRDIARWRATCSAAVLKNVDASLATVRCHTLTLKLGLPSIVPATTESDSADLRGMDCSILDIERRTAGPGL